MQAEPLEFPVYKEMIEKEFPDYFLSKNWLFVVAPAVTLLLVGILILKYLLVFLPEQIPCAKWLLGLFEAAWSFVMIVVFLCWISIKYYLTNLRLIEERDIIGKSIMSIWLDKVQDVTCKFGILGKIFGFGDIFG